MKVELFKHYIFLCLDVIPVIFLEVVDVDYVTDEDGCLA